MERAMETQSAGRAGPSVVWQNGRYVAFFHPAAPRCIRGTRSTDVRVGRRSVDLSRRLACLSMIMEPPCNSTTRRAICGPDV
jgi:hypothetical protein